MKRSRLIRAGLAAIAVGALAMAVWFPRRPSPIPLDLAQFGGAGIKAPPAIAGTRFNKPAGSEAKAKAARQRVQAGERPAEAARQRTSESIQRKFAALTRRQQAAELPPIHGAGRGYGQKVLNQAQQEAVNSLLQQAGSGVALQMDPTSGTLRYLRGDLKSLVEGSPAFEAARAGNNYERMAVATLEVLPRVMNIRNPASEFRAQPADRDELNMAHVKLDQQYQGVPIYGAQVIVHLSPEGFPVEVHGVYAPTPSDAAAPGQAISEQLAIEKARAAVNSAGAGLRPPRAERKYYWDPNVAPILSYQVDLVPSATACYAVFVAVADGSIVHVASKAFTAAATGQSQDLLGRNQTVNSWQEGASFLAIDTSLVMYDGARSRPPTFTNVFGGICVFDVQGQDVEAALNSGVNYIASANKDQWDATAVSVLSHFRSAFDYFKGQHNRSSWDDQGITLTGLIHAKFKNSSGQLYTDNAFFNPSMNIIVCGEGEQICAPGMLPAARDIVAHEYSHGVVDHSAAFKYENQSGALHEHMADYFGSLIEGKNWMLGEDAMQGTGKAGWRDLSNPANPNVSSPGPKTMAEYKNLPNTSQGDLGGVHVNSTIPSYAAYLFTAGPQGLGTEQAGKIVYRALTKYMTQNSDFIDYRRATLSAAQDLFPDGSASNVIAQAFDAAQILEAQTAPPPTPVPATAGDEFVLFLRAEYDPWLGFAGYGLYQLSAQDYHLVASQYVERARPAISGTGTWALYVGQDNNVYWTDGTQEEAWTDSQDVRTIGLSKDQRYIAFTTTDYDNKIIIIDTTTEQIRTATIRIPTSGDEVSLSYADVLTFNCSNDYLFFDAWSEGKLGQTDYGCWGLCSLRLKDLECRAVLPLTPGLQVGNPSLANTLPYSLVADYLYTTNNQEVIGSVYLDLNQNQMSVLLKGLAVYATASFRGDDTKIVYQSYQNSLSYLNEATLTSDRSALVNGSIKGLLWSQTALEFPVGFRAGSYTPPAGNLTVEPGSIDFGPVARGQAVTNSLVLNNTGNADLDLIEVSLENGEINSYDFASTVEKRIPAGRSQTLKLRFHPEKSGDLRVSLRLKTTVPGQADVTVNLAGQGKAGATGDSWRQVWQDFQDNYSYFEYKNVNWAAVYDAHTNDFANATPDQFAEKLNDVLQVLHDWHVSVTKPDGTAVGYRGSYSKNYSVNFFSQYTGGAPYTNINGAGVIWHATVSNNIAYVVIDSFDTSRWSKITDATIEELFAAFANASGLILDFRSNNGGNEENASRLASRLITEPVTYGYVRTRIAQSVPYQFSDFTAKTLEPATGTKYLKPVVGLVGQRCMSSAEWFALMLKKCPNAMLMGDRTRGASGGPITKSIPDLNVQYAISRWIAYTDQKTPFEDQGIAPAIRMAAEASYNDNLSRDYLLERAIDYLTWRQMVGQQLPLISEFTDKDRDGVRDLDEFLAGTDPADPKSWFGFRTLKANPAGGVTLQWGSLAGRQYHLLRAASVNGAFAPIASDLPATPPLNSYTDASATGKGPCFYRLQLKP